MKKTISFPIAVTIIVACAILTGLLAWQYGLIPGIGPNGSSPGPSEKEVTITTDKTEYEQGEIVKITVKNNLDYSVTPGVGNLVKPDRSLGENYGIGLIEKFEDDKWVAIEPVWRCEGEFSSCFAECSYMHSFKPGETRVFEWDQTVHICNIIDRTEKVENAGAGKYRVGSSIWFTEERTYKTIYSNEFTINEKETVIEFPIDSEAEAIAYAKTEPDVKEFIEEFSTEGFYVSAKYKSDEDIWVVWFYGHETEISYGIAFDQYGVISSKGWGI